MGVNRRHTRCYECDHERYYAKQKLPDGLDTFICRQAKRLQKQYERESDIDVSYCLHSKRVLHQWDKQEGTCFECKQTLSHIANYFMKKSIVDQVDEEIEHAQRNNLLYEPYRARLHKPNFACLELQQKANGTYYIPVWICLNCRLTLYPENRHDIRKRELFEEKRKTLGF